MRSRLEARWAAFFDLLGWDRLWDYEPLDLDTFRIPDFVMRFANPTIIECKPAFTVQEITERRREMITSARAWLGVALEHELHAIDQESGEDLARTDALLDALAAFDAGENPSCLQSRRALVVGSQFYLHGDAVSVDGEHYFTACTVGDPHVGLHRCAADPANAGISWCLVCGSLHAPTPLASAEVLDAWREAGAKVQWLPPAEAKGKKRKGRRR